MQESESSRERESERARERESEKARMRESERARERESERVSSQTWRPYMYSLLRTSLASAPQICQGNSGCGCQTPTHTQSKFEKAVTACVTGCVSARGGGCAHAARAACTEPKHAALHGPGPHTHTHTHSHTEITRTFMNVHVVVELLASSTRTLLIALSKARRKTSRKGSTSRERDVTSKGSPELNLDF